MNLPADPAGRSSNLRAATREEAAASGYDLTRLEDMFVKIPERKP